MNYDIKMRLRELTENLWKRCKALVSPLENRVTNIEQAGYITQETDPTVPSWAKASTKPTYTASDVGAKAVQTAVSDPSASGTSVTFIDSISQNAQGVISPSKKTVKTMTGATSGAAGAAGLVPQPAAGDDGKYLKGDGTWGTPSGGGSVTGVKGNAEGSYRTGNVNLTPADIGARSDAAPTSGAYFSGTPQVLSDGVMEVGKYIDFHATDGATSDYDARISADTNGLTLSGTTSGTFSGNLTGNVTGDVTGNLAGNVTGNCSGNAANVTGVVAIANGGTGQTGTTAPYVGISNIVASIATDWDVTEAYCAQWGKLMNVKLRVKRTGTTITTPGTYNVCTLKDYLYPLTDSFVSAPSRNVEGGALGMHGEVNIIIYDQWGQYSTKSLYITYILA